MVRRTLAENIAGANRLSVEIMISDARMALTLLDMAETTRVPENKARRISEAVVAYRSIVSFLAQRQPTTEQFEVLRELLGRLKSRLQAAGAHLS